MFLKKLQLGNFKNYENSFFEFSDGLNCIVGKNGSGKTNLLDAIYFLSLCKSSIHNQDILSIRFDKDYLQIEGYFHLQNEKEFIACHYQKGSKKVFSQDGKAYERISDHIGKYPVVLIAPDDTDLIRDASDTRRKLFDGIISQTNPEYLKSYQLHNRVLDQRNSLLKQFAEHNYFDEDLLKIYSDQLLEYAVDIYNKRAEFINLFIPIFKKHYTELSEDAECVEIEYNSDAAKPNFKDVFTKNIAQDLAAQRTTKGVHKDEYVFTMNGNPVKKFGSQGQKKSFIMAIRLAQFEIIESLKGMKPILLLDDIFDKLDELRIHKLMSMVNDGVFGQVFLTDARPNRTAAFLKSLNAEVNFIEIKSEH